MIDEESAGLVRGEEPLEIEVDAARHMDCSGFRNRQFEHVDIVRRAVGNVDKTGNISTRIQQRMHHRYQDRRCRRRVKPRKLSASGLSWKSEPLGWDETTASGGLNPCVGQ